MFCLSSSLNCLIPGQSNSKKLYLAFLNKVRRYIWDLTPCVFSRSVTKIRIHVTLVFVFFGIVQFMQLYVETLTLRLRGWAFKKSRKHINGFMVRMLLVTVTCFYGKGAFEYICLQKVRNAGRLSRKVQSNGNMFSTDNARVAFK